MTSNNPFGSTINRTEQRYPALEPPPQFNQNPQAQAAYPSPSFQYPPQQYPPQQYQPQQYQQQQFQQFSPSIQDFDPYHSLSTLHANQIQAPPPPTSQASLQMLHPRDYVSQNKSSLTNFEASTWERLLASVDTLRGSWENRSRVLQALRGTGADPSTLEALIRESGDNIDSCHASRLQFAETQMGYRQSTDLASKNRVRENLNAALRNLPLYPSPLPPNQVQEHNLKKESILAGYNSQIPQQMQPTGAFYQQAQPTGYGGYGIQPQMTGYPQGPIYQPQQYLNQAQQYPNQQYQPQPPNGYAPTSMNGQYYQ